MTHASLARALALCACALCLLVVVLGAYVRLSNAGLGCPDWPGCYGHLAPTTSAAQHPTSVVAGSVDLGKAWREMVHRYAAGTLACLILCLAALGVLWRRERVLPLPLVLTLPLVVLLQAALGMLTVTWQLTPLIVTMHLLFGLTTLGLLWWLVLTLFATPLGITARIPAPALARSLALIGLLALALQIALGGWTSSNYAAIACPDLPTCQGSWWPRADFHSAYILWRNLSVNYEGGILDNPARVAIHLVHRLGALCVSALLLAAALASLRGPERSRGAAIAVLLMLGLQLTIGVTMVLRGFPLWLATAHNAGAALLLLATLGLNRSLWPVRAPRRVSIRVPHTATVSSSA
jgi:heme a synthase